MHEVICIHGKMKARDKLCLKARFGGRIVAGWALLLIALLVTAGCAPSGKKESAASEATLAAANGTLTAVHGREAILELLSDPLWTERDAYDAGHYLMIPLHYAVWQEDEALLGAFRRHFQALLAAYHAGEVNLPTLHELQYLTLVSRYLALVSDLPADELAHDLAELVLGRFLYYWEQKPAWQWARDPFEGGVRERLEWKLTTGDPTRSYYSVIIDEELYLIGMAADLLVWHQAQGQECPRCAEAVEFFDRIIQDRLDKDQQGWVFQKGMWRDHPD